ncbi:MAG: hypothetical protein ACI8PQ_000659 [Planctomycetota bacterium]|jgi:hypothetical protein
MRYGINGRQSAAVATLSSVLRRTWIGLLTLGVLLGSNSVGHTQFLVEEGGDLGTAPAPAPSAVAAVGTVVGLDARNGFDRDARLAVGGDFDELRARLVARGLVVVPLEVFSEERLAGLDLLVLQQPYAPDQRFTNGERRAIYAFVARGGSLLVHGDSGGQSDGQLRNLNQLLLPLGVRFGSALPGEEGVDGLVVDQALVVQGLRSHPVTRGLRSFVVDFPRRMVEISTPAVDLTWGSGRNDVLAAVDEPNFGRVVILGDVSLWMDADAGSNAGLASPGNGRLLGNILDHLLLHVAEARPLPALGQSLQPVGLRVRLEGLRDAWLGMPSAASAVLRLLIPDDSSSGCFVQLSVRGAQPGSMVLVLLGEATNAGTLAHPQLLDTVLVGADGTATFSVLVPYSAADHSFGLRLIDPLTGETSPVIGFEPRR